VERIKKLEKKLQEKEQELEQISMKLSMPPFTFTMSNFNQLKTMDTCWYSPPMYTHNLWIQILHCGVCKWVGQGKGTHVTVYLYSMSGECKGTHVTVYLYSMSGEFDATLQWPAKFTITLQLLNQHRDQDHITVTKQFQWTKSENDWVYAGDFIPL